MGKTGGGMTLALYDCDSYILSMHVTNSDIIGPKASFIVEWESETQDEQKPTTSTVTTVCSSEVK